MEDGYDVGYIEGQMDAKGEIEQLKAENEQLKAENERLKAENERLKKLWRDDERAGEQRESELKERIDYLEGYIKMLKDNSVSDVIGEVL